MNELEGLVATNLIIKVKARYFRCMDTRDWDGFQTCFTEDCEFDVSLADVVVAPGKQPFANDPTIVRDDWVHHGAKAIREFVSALLIGIRTVHHGHMAEIEFEGPTSARAIFAMEDLLDYPEGYPQTHIRGHGHYHERYERIGGDWKIAQLKLTRLRVQRL